MARRKYNIASQPKPFEHAFYTISKMEECVCYRTVTCDYDLRDVCDWLWPPEVVRALREAFQYIKPGDRTSAHDTMSLPDNELPPVHVKFMLCVKEDLMCAPRPGLISLQHTPKADAIEASLREVAEVHRKFQQVRKVVGWLNDNATVGAAAYYFPVLRSLLPAAHAIHETKGELYREPKRPVAEIAADMREAMTTIAMGLISYDANYTHEASNFQVNICDNPPFVMIQSQTFCLI